MSHDLTSYRPGDRITRHNLLAAWQAGAIDSYRVLRDGSFAIILPPWAELHRHWTDQREDRHAR